MSEIELDREGFARMWSALGARDASAFDVLQVAYGSEGRCYHDNEHIRECLAYFERVRDRAPHPERVEAAIWFHDAVYDVRSADNEARSAELLCELAASGGIAPSEAQEIATLVLCTKHDAATSGEDAHLLRDVDLSILGALQKKQIFALPGGTYL